MHFTIPLFERKTSSGMTCVTLGLGPATQTREGQNPHKIHRKLIDNLRTAFEKIPAHELARIEMPRGIRLERVRLELTLAGAGERRKVSGICPVVIAPRWASISERLLFAYHPERQDDAAPIREDRPLDEQIRALFQKTWAELEDEKIAALWCRGKERIGALSFSCTPRSALEDLPPRKEDPLGGDPAYRQKKRRGLKVLPSLGMSLTLKAIQGDLAAGVPRSPQREQLALLLGAGRAQAFNVGRDSAFAGPSILVAGPPGCGKTTLIHQAVRDLLEADGYGTHRNLDRVREVWQVSGRRLIAGMSRLGDWEKRCVEVLADARSRPVILAVDDLHHFGRIGQSRESERSLADFFRGPLARRELTIIGECTPEALRRLEQDAPSFAALFTPVFLPEATPAETFRLMVREVRSLEQRHRLAVSPYALRTLLDAGGALLSGHALPGKAMELLRELAAAAPEEPAEGPKAITSRHVLSLLSQRTGVPEILLGRDEPLDAAAIEEALGGQVIGQAEAVRAAADLVVRVKAGLVDPRRPYGVYLFTGPTGTGKTELAKCVAEYLYGSASRLLRFDMSELSGPDAPSRLIGHRYAPEGMLTQRIQEQPFSLVLLDEIEKAHPSVQALLLQLFEDGRLTDAAGRTAHFQHAVIIMTSNLGARARGPVGFGEGGSAARSAAAAEERLKEIASAVREFFPPELFNRIDRVVPFRPLTPDVATRVAEKELGKLFRRRGLAERSIFVHAGAGVAERLSGEAFAAEDGARSVKRAIEARIGGLLSDAIACTGAAAMQILRIFTHEGSDGFGLDREVLQEANPADAVWALEPLLARPLPALLAELGPLSEFLGALDQRGDLAHLSERICHHLRERSLNVGRESAFAAPSAPEAIEHAEAVYNLDAMRAAITAFRERIDVIRRRSEDDREVRHFALEMERFGYVRREDEWSHTRIRLFRHSQLPQPQRRLTRSEILECIAEAHALRRALGKVDDPGQHAVLIELLRAGHVGDGPRFAQPGEGLLEALARAYADGRGELTAWALARRGGEIARGGATSLDSALRGDADLLVLGVVGLCVHDFYELETGTHVWTSLGRGPELVRVRVVSAAPGATPLSAVEQHLAGKAAFDEAARLGRPLPPNPAALLPVVRKIRFDPPRTASHAAPLEIEDYVMGYVETALARSLGQALAPLWLLRMSREDVAP